MDRENLYAPGWSHVLSTTNDIAELEAAGLTARVLPVVLPDQYIVEARRAHDAR